MVPASPCRPRAGTPLILKSSPMKRSEINKEIESALAFFSSLQFHLPVWATWSPRDWEHNWMNAEEIRRNQLGWDLTDFGSGDYQHTGLLLFTIRNGNPETDQKGYCEKIMIVGEKQVTPRHYHARKMEDIINRGGGNLILELFHAQQDKPVDDKLIEVKIDGIIHHYREGEKVRLEPGQSICFPPYLAHRFYGEEGKGRVLVGEVSSVNDDLNDNHFPEGVGRFPDIIEDVTPRYLLAGDY